MRLSHKLITGLSLTSLLTTVAAFAGNTSSGGGDPIRFAFIDGKKQAAYILDVINAADAAKKMRPESRAIFHDLQHALQADVHGSEHEWTEDEQQITCARTEYTPRAPVSLSFSKCRVMIRDKEQAGRQLIHESLHHLGIKNEKIADDIATGVYVAWEEKMLKEIPLCEGTHSVAPLLDGKWIGEPALNLRLRGKKMQYELEIKADNTILKTLPGIKKCAYAGGTITTVEKNDDGTVKQTNGPVPFALIELRGQPALAFFEKEKDGRWDLEFSLVFAARAQKENLENSILFIGGDHDTEPFMAFVRPAK